MKRNRYSSSSASDSEAQESNRPKSRKPDSKNPRIEEMPQMDDLENFSLKDLGRVLIVFKNETRSTLEGLSNLFTQFRLEIQHEVKIVKENANEIQTSLNSAWTEIEDLQKQFSEQNVIIKSLNTKVDNQQLLLDSEKQKRLHLDAYSRRENLRLIGVPEEEDENDEQTEKTVRDILDEMGLLREGLTFHAGHRVGPNRSDRTSPRQIIMRFLVRKDKERVWQNREKILKSVKFGTCFFTLNYPKEIADERSLLRKIAKRARDVLEIKAEVRRNKLHLVDSGLSYSLKEIPQYLCLPEY